MRTAVYILAMTILTLIACNESQLKVIEPDRTTNDSTFNATRVENKSERTIPVTREQLIAQIKRDTFLLGFKYGMNSEELSNHLDSLVNENILKMNEDENLSGIITIHDHGAYKFTFSPFLQNDIIYGAGYSLSYPEVSIQLNYSNWTDFLDRQFGSHIEKTLESVGDIKQWLLNNIQISLWIYNDELSLEFRNSKLEESLLADNIPIKIYINKEGKIIVNGEEISVGKIDKELEILKRTNPWVDFARNTESKYTSEVSDKVLELVMKHQFTFRLYTDETFTAQTTQLN